MSTNLKNLGTPAFTILQESWTPKFKAGEKMIAKAIDIPEGYIPVGVKLPKSKDLLFGTSSESGLVELFSEYRGRALQVKRIWCLNPNGKEVKSHPKVFIKIICLAE